MRATNCDLETLTRVYLEAKSERECVPFGEFTKKITVMSSMNGEELPQASHMMKYRYRWVLLLTFGLYTCYTYFLAFAYASLIPLIMKELGISFGEAGLLASAYYATYAVMQVPAGILVDSYGGRKIMTLTFLLLSGSAISFPFSSDLVTGSILRGLMGIGASFVFVPAFKILSGWFQSDERGTAFGIFSSFGFIGTLVAQALIPYVLPFYHGDWRTELTVAALPSILLAPSCLLLVRERPSGHVFEDPEPRAGIARAKKIIIHVLRDKNIRKLNVAGAILFGTIFSLLTWIPSYITSLNFPLVVAGFAASLVSIGMIGANIIAGTVSDKTGRRRPVFSVGFSLPIVSIILLTQVGLVSGEALLYVLCFSLGLSNISAILTPTIALESFPSTHRGTVVGLINSVAWVGAFTLPTAMGFVLDVTGSFQSGFLLLVASLSIALVMSLTVKEGDRVRT